MTKANPIKSTVATSIKRSVDANLGTPCYYLVCGFDQVKVIAEKDPEQMAMLREAIPGFDLIQPRDEIPFDPTYSVQYQKVSDPVTRVSRNVLVSIKQQPPKPVEEVKSVAEIPFESAYDDVLRETVAEDTDPLASGLDEWFPRSDKTGDKPFSGPWSALLAKPESQSFAAYGHFKRECQKIDKIITDAGVIVQISIALAPDTDIPPSIERRGIKGTIDLLQARGEYLREHPKEIAMVDKSALGPVLTKEQWADFLTVNKIKSADMLKVLGIAKLSEWHGTLDDALSIYNTKNAEVITEDELAEMEGGPADDRSNEPPDEPEGNPVPTMPVDAVIKSTGELIPMPRDPNKAILHVKSTKALVDHMFNDKVLIAGVDYGTLPGGRENAKPSLLKPGAEKLLDAFQFYPVFKPTANSKADWTGNGFFNFEYDCVICDRVTGRIEGSGIGSCNSMESKYRYRWLYDNEVKAQGLNITALHSKVFPKKGGGTYTKYRVENEDIFDIVNTLSKMAQKRSLVAATLNATGASAVFTQDTEDFADWGLMD